MKIVNKLHTKLDKPFSQFVIAYWDYDGSFWGVGEAVFNTLSAARDHIKTNEDDAGIYQIIKVT